MFRRAAALLAIAVITTVVLGACGDSDPTTGGSESESGELSLVAETIDLSSDRVGGWTILVDDDDSVKVEVPDTALPDGLDPTDITATVDRLVANEIGAGVEFSLGPDGTEFAEPVTLSWVADWNPEGTFTVTAVADDGTNLLPDREDADEVLKTLQVVPNDDGSSTISVEIDHFSTWSFVHYGNLLPAITNDSGFLLGAQSGVEGGDFYVIAGVLNSFLGDMKVSQPVLCASLVELNLRGVRSDRSIASQGRKCDDGIDPSVEFWFPFTCLGPGIGTVDGLVEAQYGLAGLSPFALLIVLAGGQELELTNANYVRRQAFWANASDALLYMRSPFSEQIACERFVTTTESVTDDETTTSLQPSTTTRSTATGTSRTTSTTVTSTTWPATTTTKPHQGATTTLPRSSTGGTTTLP